MVEAVASAHITVEEWLGSGPNPRYRSTEMKRRDIELEQEKKHEYKSVVDIHNKKDIN